MGDEMDEVKNRIEKVETWRTKTETRLAIVEANVETIKEKMEKIDNNTTWLVRLVAGAIVLGAMAYLFDIPV